MATREQLNEKLRTVIRNSSDFVQFVQTWGGTARASVEIKDDAEAYEKHINWILDFAERKKLFDRLGAHYGIPTDPEAERLARERTEERAERALRYSLFALCVSAASVGAASAVAIFK